MKTIEERTGSDPLETFERAVKNATPLVEVKLAGLAEQHIKYQWKCALTRYYTSTTLVTSVRETTPRTHNG
jgi:ribosomal protein S7